MAAWKLILEYDGTRYSGWQEQKNARTVMGELRQAAEAVLRTPVELKGAGRTDAGVHAAAQVAHLRSPTRKLPKPADLLAALNDALPADIAILSLEQATARFDARHDADQRTYLYQIATRKMAFSKKYVWWVKAPLDVEAMQRACGWIAGRHDFAAFCAKDPAKPGESTIVVVEAATVEREEDLILFRIVASHYLWRMVRRLVGTLVKVGLGEITAENFRDLIDNRGRPEWDVPAWTAPAAGLFLEDVRYPRS